MNRPPALWEDTETTKQIKAALPVSIGLHAMLLVVLVAQGLFFQSKALPPPSYEVVLIGPIKKGKPGGAPAIPKPLPADKAGPIPPVNPPPAADPQELVIPSGKDAKSDALARAQREAALNRARQLAAQNAATNVASASTPIPGATPPPTGNPGGGAGDGDGGSEYGVEWSTLSGAATYEQQLQAIVNDNWLPPTWVSDKQPLQCVVRVKIGFDGKIAGSKIEQSSGNAAFDASTLIALKKSDPLPPPPLDLKPHLAKKGVPLRFDSRVRSAAGTR